MPFFFFLPVMIAVSVVVAVSASRKDRERNDVWQRWAAAREWGYAPTWPQVVGAFTGGPFGRGSLRRADRGFWGTFDGVPVFGFRYRYTVSSGKTSHTYPLLLAGIRFPGAAFPPMELIHEGDLLFGRDKDLQFENQQFNETWNVTSPSARFAHDVLHPRAMEYLMGPMIPFKHLWFCGDVLFVSVSGDPAPTMADGLLRLMTDFVDLLPSHLLREVGATDPQVDDSGPGVSVEEQQRRMADIAAQQAYRSRRSR
ncbi:hypothetical protein [Tessaracoccus antarcticus]|uniref:DUF3137 domain-containing protein n=1 Tax=Tessaracoccus antarcticus TaxID=2479848 RepID=A0A3M0GX80_9ACTN|nr:hypothetical protein [Tessaracoccus antarcticus]RMB61976.1 hypothetical protein EAX62_05145 [Tessaracoccus antarcticus]